MWSDAFLTALQSRSLRLEFRVEVVPVRWSGTGAADAPGEPWVACTSHHAAVGSGKWMRLQSAPQVSGGVLTMQTWTASIGAASFTLAGDATELLRCVPRGSFVRIWAGWQGLAPSAYEQIWTGRVEQIRWEAGVWAVSCLDLGAALQSRPTRQVLYSQLFYGVGDTTTVGPTAYAVGDTTLEVASTVGFERETGGRGAVLVEPASGSPFYLVWTASTATTLTVVDADYHGTTRHSAALGRPVSEVALLEGHPAHIALKVLTSTGTGTNGLYDLLPVSWGLGLPWGLIDLADVGRTVAVVGAEDMDWQVIVSDQVDDGYAWLRGLLSLGGLYLTTHHGRLTIRAVESPSARTAYQTWRLRASDVVDARLAYDPYSDDVPTEYADTTVESATGQTSSTFSISSETLPMSPLQTRDLSSVIWATESDQRDGLLSRLEAWDRRVPERLSWEAPMRWAAAAVGDRVVVELDGLPSRFGSLFGREGMITSIDVDWNLYRVSVVVQISPP